MDERMKQRLVGAAVLVIAAVVFIPMVLDRADEEVPRVLPAPTVVAPEEPLPPDAGARAVPLTGAPTAAPPERSDPAPDRPVSQPPASATEKAPPVAKAASPPASAKTGFAVQLGSFSKADNARGLRDKLAAKGYQAFVRGAGSVTRVYVGPEPSRAAAEAMLKKLEAETKLKGIVVTLPG